MEPLKICNDYVYQNLKTNNNKKINLVLEKDLDFTACTNNLYLDTFNLFKERPEFRGGALKGGANKISKKQEPKKEKSVLDINRIGSEILKELLGDRMNIGISGDDARLMQFVLSFLTKHAYNLDNSEYEFLLRFLRDNLFKALKDNIKTKHSLVAVSEYNLTSDISLTPITATSLSSDVFKRNIAISQEVSSQWDGLTMLNDVILSSTGIENIHPLFICLFGNKLPVIEDLIIESDYQNLIEEVRNNEVPYQSQILLMLRMSDTDMLPTNNKDYTSSIGNETLRMSISVLLRELSISIRTGCFEDSISPFLCDLLKNVQMPGAKFKEENMLKAILAAFSFKPTLITRGMMPRGILNIGTPSYNVPRSVYTIEYPISDIYCFTDNNIPKLTQTDFELLGFDPLTKKVVFTYSNNEELIHEEQGSIIKNLFNALSVNKIEVDVNNILPSIISRQPGIESVYQNISPVKVMLSSGTMFITIPREQSRITSYPSSNIFFRPNIKPTINLSPVLVEPYITVGKATHELTSALCFDIIDSERHSFGSAYFGNHVNTVCASKKLGTFSIVKSNGRWYEINPQSNITLGRRKEKVERAVKNYYIDNYLNGVYEDFTRVGYESWLVAYKDEANKKKQKVEENKLVINDFRISETEALEKISTRACILIYAENYDNYRSRVLEKIF